MIRIAGVNLNPNKQIKFALTPIRGLGKSNVRKVIANFGYSTTTILASLSDQEVVDLRNYIESNFIVEADLRRRTMGDIKRLIDLSTWRGLRHKLGLPTRGQTTRTNSRTRRGNLRKTGGSGRAKSASKT